MLGFYPANLPRNPGGIKSGVFGILPQLGILDFGPGLPLGGASLRRVLATFVEKINRQRIRP
jgi:hypothetical protein